MSARMPLTVGMLAWMLLAQGATAQQAATASAPNTGRISGRLVVANAGDLADARVTLTPIGTDSPLTGAVTSSDRQGLFTFDRLAAGRYRIVASKRGYTDRRLVQSPAPHFESGLDLTVKNDEQISRVDVALHREASIAGRIAEPDGIPAPDVKVVAAVRRDNGYALLSDTQTTAEWDGRYRLSGLPPGEYLIAAVPSPTTDPDRVRANAERRAPESSSSTRPYFENTFYPSVTRSEAGEVIRVLEGVSVGGIDVWLAPAQRYSVSGRLHWPDGLDVENVAIEYESLSAQRGGLWTVSDPGGLFTITGVPAGTLVLLARADSNKGPLAGVVSTQVTVDAVDDLEFTLDTPGAVEGRIVYEADVPTSGRARRLVFRQRLLRVSPLYPAPEASIGADGRFQISNALGEYEVDLMGMPAGLRVTRMTQEGRALPNNRIGIAAGDHITAIEIVVGK